MSHVSVLFPCCGALADYFLKQLHTFIYTRTGVNNALVGDYFQLRIYLAVWYGSRMASKEKVFSFFPIQ